MAGQPIPLLLDREKRLYGVAADQAGYFTAKQAEQAGYRQPLHSHHVKTGRWLRVGTGLYRLPTLPLNPEDQYVRISLWSRNRLDQPQGVFGFETAFALHELSDLMPARVHLIVPPAFRKAPPVGLVLHRGVLPNADVQQRTGYHVTTPLRTLLDVAGSSTSAEHLHQGLREALQRGLVRRRTLERRLAEPCTSDQAKRRLLSALETM